MTKAEKLIQNGEVESNEEFYVNTTDVLSAMQEQSVKFAEWTTLNNWKYQTMTETWFKGISGISFEVGEERTTAELYEIFNKL